MTESGILHSVCTALISSKNICLASVAQFGSLICFSIAHDLTLTCLHAIFIESNRLCLSEIKIIVCLIKVMVYPAWNRSVCLLKDRVYI